MKYFPRFILNNPQNVCKLMEIKLLKNIFIIIPTKIQNMKR